MVPRGGMNRLPLAVEVEPPTSGSRRCRTLAICLCATTRHYYNDESTGVDGKLAGKFGMTGQEGVEPPSANLEFAVLPLDD